jgi:serine/threonine-protein kinase
MLQPDPAQRPSMAEIEDWSIGSARSQPARKAERPLATDRANDGRPTRTWIRLSALVATIALLLGASGLAYYQYVWNAKLVVTAPPVASLEQGKLPRPMQTNPPSSVPAKELSKAFPKEPPKEAVKDATKEAAMEPPKELRPSPDVPGRSDLIRRFIQQYEGGDCFFVMPVAVGTSAAVVEGFGASTAPFEALDRTIKKTQGFEAQIGVRMVTTPQCPAITFLNKMRGDPSHAPRISLGSVKIRPNETISGNVENFANRVVELLLVSEDGLVQNLSYLLKPGTDALSFSIEMKRAEETLGSNVPQLVMAVTSPRVLDSLRQPRPTPADQFFLQVTSEAQRANMTLNAATRYVTIQK